MMAVSPNVINPWSGSTHNPLWHDDKLHTPLEHSHSCFLIHACTHLYIHSLFPTHMHTNCIYPHTHLLQMLMHSHSSSLIHIHAYTCCLSRTCTGGCMYVHAHTHTIMQKRIAILVFIPSQKINHSSCITFICS